MENKNQPAFPKSWSKLIGKEMFIEGQVFGNKSIDRTKVIVIALRYGHGYITSLDGGPKYKSIQLLVKNEQMKRARWTLGYKGQKTK